MIFTAALLASLAVIAYMLADDGYQEDRPYLVVTALLVVALLVEQVNL